MTLRKTEREYAPQLMYRDHALSPELFHRESQNARSVNGSVGQRYLSHRERGTHVLLLARTTRTGDWGGPRPFLCLGPALYMSHDGDRPIAITWRLRHRLPVEVFRAASLTG